ncbi:lysoplasmalogenase [Lysobacter fragariae]
MTAPASGVRRWVMAVAIAASLAIAGALAPELRWLHYVAKPTATLLVAAMVWRSPAIEPRYRSAILAGLLLSTLGDVFLMLPSMAKGPDWFVFGLASFLFAHVAYLVAFCSRVRLFAVKWPFALYAIIAGGVLSVLWPHLPAELRVPVVAYVAVLATMAAQAAAVWSRLRTPTAAVAALGGVFFVASDATLAIDRFVAPFGAAIVIVLATYWAAQVLIGASARRSH